MKTLLLALVLVLLVGCNIPKHVYDDMTIIQTNNTLVHDFNSKFLKRVQVHDSEQLNKKSKMYSISETSFRRLERALTLLSEYLESTKYLDEKQIALTNELINQIAEKVAEKVQRLR